MGLWLRRALGHRVGKPASLDVTGEHNQHLLHSDEEEQGGAWPGSSHWA